MLIGEINGDVTDVGRTDRQTKEQKGKIVLLSLWTVDTGGIFQIICRCRCYCFTFFESIIWEIGDRKNRERSKKCGDIFPDFFPGLRSE